MVCNHTLITQFNSLVVEQRKLAIVKTYDQKSKHFQQAAEKYLKNHNKQINPNRVKKLHCSHLNDSSQNSSLWEKIFEAYKVTGSTQNCRELNKEESQEDKTFFNIQKEFLKTEDALFKDKAFKTLEDEKNKILIQCSAGNDTTLTACLKQNTFFSQAKLFEKTLTGIALTSEKIPDYLIQHDKAWTKLREINHWNNAGGKSYAFEKMSDFKAVTATLYSPSLLGYLKDTFGGVAQRTQVLAGIESNLTQQHAQVDALHYYLKMVFGIGTQSQQLLNKDFPPNSPFQAVSSQNTVFGGQGPSFNVSSNNANISRT